MKKSLTGIVIIGLLCSGCYTSRTGYDNSGAVLTGAAIGGNVGSAVGGLIGEGSNGWRGGYRGSAIGTIVGTIAGAAIANAATTPKKQQEDANSNYYRVEPKQDRRTQMQASRQPSAIDHLKIQNIRFIDDSRDHVISSGENSKLIFEIMNEGSETAYNVVPVVTETTGMKRIYISPSVLIEQIAPRNGVKYTANISAGSKIKTGEVNIRIVVADEYGNEYDYQQFPLPTQR